MEIEKRVEVGELSCGVVRLTKPSENAGLKIRELKFKYKIKFRARFE